MVVVLVVVVVVVVVNVIVVYLPDHTIFNLRLLKLLMLLLLLLLKTLMLWPSFWLLVYGHFHVQPIYSVGVVLSLGL